MNPARRERIMRAAAMRQLDLAVVLDHVHDAHNIGAVMRTCDAVGIQKIFALYSKTRPRMKKVRLGKRTSAGTRKWVDVYYYTDLRRLVDDLHASYSAVLASLARPGSRSIYSCDFTQSTALVFGNEHAGISDELARYCTGTIRIPQVGMAQSLNISVACAVVLYEVMRQRTAAGMYQVDATSVDGQIRTLQNDWLERHANQYKGRSMQRPPDD